MKIRNPFIKKILIIIISVVLFSVALFFAIKIITRSYDNLTYDLGEKSDKKYEDIILTSYYDYLEFADNLGIKKHLKENDFTSNYYLASFQDYDSCSESKPKGINNIIRDNNDLNITFDVYNKCGFCKKHIMLHLIKIDNNQKDSNINYDYNYITVKECGEV